MKTIGTITTCNSSEHRYLNHSEVKIVAVTKGAAAPDLDPDADLSIAFTDEELARLGGLDANDRVEVVPWIESAGRFSFVSSDPKATDLAAWKLLAARK
ncbi:MAG: hypothetical protein RBU45_14410 [Myxococcota bacterium]|jgi:streptogramin lyase|nr:hypothetical protein [Myxococcota bacterium]